MKNLIEAMLNSGLKGCEELSEAVERIDNPLPVKPKPKKNPEKTPVVLSRIIPFQFVEDRSTLRFMD